MSDLGDLITALTDFDFEKKKTSVNIIGFLNFFCLFFFSRLLRNAIRNLKKKKNDLSNHFT